MRSEETLYKRPRITNFLLDDISALLLPRDCEFFHWHHTYFSLTLSCEHPKLISEITLSQTHLLFQSILRAHNYSDIPEESVGRIRKSMSLLLIFWVIPEQWGGFGRNVAVRLCLPLLYYSLWRFGRGSRDNPQTGAEVRNVQGKLAVRYVSYSLASYRMWTFSNSSKAHTGCCKVWPPRLSLYSHAHTAWCLSSLLLVYVCDLWCMQRVIPSDPRRERLKPHTESRHQAAIKEYIAFPQV